MVKLYGSSSVTRFLVVLHLLALTGQVAEAAAPLIMAGQYRTKLFPSRRPGKCWEVTEYLNGWNVVETKTRLIDCPAPQGGVLFAQTRPKEPPSIISRPVAAHGAASSPATDATASAPEGRR